MKQSIKTRIICLIVAGVMLTGALTVAAINGSPYETLKNAFFNALAYDNFTLEGEIIITFNGEVYESERIHFIQGNNSFIEFGDSRNFARGMDGDKRFSYFYSDGVSIRPDFTPSDGAQWYSARTSHPGVRRHNHSWPGITPAERNSARVRFTELFIDLLVGDLRNNMHMSQAGDIRRISGNITHSQLPEIIKLGIEMMLEEELRWHRGSGREPAREDFAGRHPINIPLQSLNFNSIRGDADIDSAGNLLYLNAGANITAVNIFGDANNIEISMIFNFSDIGTSAPINPVPGASELLTHDFFEREFNRRYGHTIYFTRNEDGSINTESITAAWPGSHYRGGAQQEQAPVEEYTAVLTTHDAFMEELEALGVDLDFLRIQLDEMGLSLDELFELYEVMKLDTVISIEDFLEIWVDVWH